MLRFYNKIIICILLLTVFIFSGCSNKSHLKTRSSGTFPPYEVIDARGEAVRLSGKPQRIVSLTYGTDEILVALVPLKRIVAFSKWAGDQEITFISKEVAGAVGCRACGSCEQIVRLEPDLVLASVATDGDLINSIEAVGIPVFVASSPKDYRQVKEKVMAVAAAVAEKEAGELLVQKMDSHLEWLDGILAGVARSSRKSVVAFSFSGPIGRRGQLFDDMLKRARVINAVSEQSVFEQDAVIGKEKIIACNPDMLLLPTWNYNGKNNAVDYAKHILNDPAYAELKAVKMKQVKFVSDRYRYVASHHYTDAVENIARAVYPEAFKSQEKRFRNN